MKIWKNVASLLAVVSIILIYASCAKKTGPFCEKVSDGYLLTGDLVKKVQDNSDYGITFVDTGGAKTVDSDTIKKALSDPSKYCTLEGKATKIGRNKVKVTTPSKLTVDLTRPVAVFSGLNSEKLRNFLSGAAGEGENCGMCYGVKGFTEVTCTDPNSIVCCENCQ